MSGSEQSTCVESVPVEYGSEDGVCAVARCESIKTRTPAARTICLRIRVESRGVKAYAAAAKPAKSCSFESRVPGQPSPVLPILVRCSFRANY